MEAQQDASGAKLEVNIDVMVDGRPLHIEAKVAGEGEAAQRAVEVLGEAIARVIATSAATSPPIVQPVAAKQFAHHKQEARPPSLAMVWLQRNRARINIGFGALLVALALLVPLIVPPAQRSEVLILTILFTLSGALLLFTAFLPGRGRAAADDEARMDSAQSIVSPAMTSSGQAARRAQLLRPAKRSPLRAGAGIALSLVFIIAGLLAPFLLGAANADERFLIMLGFVPITVVGFFMLAIFGRQYVNKLLPAGNAAPAKTASTPAKRAPVSRVPQNFEYRAIVPAAIVGALALMVIVVAVVIFATIASVAR